VNGYGEKDSIEITGVSTSDITFMSYSNNVEISVNNNGTVSLIVLRDILHSDDIVYDINSFNALNVGDISTNLTAYNPPENSDLDSYSGTLEAPAEVSVLSADVVLKDDATIPSAVEVTGYGLGDSIQISGVTTSEVSFMSYSTDVEISINKGGVVSLIALKDIIEPGEIIYSIDSFNALNVGDLAVINNQEGL
jgi:hypothetical protein